MTFTISATPAEGFTPLTVLIEIEEEPTIEAVTYSYTFGDGETNTETTTEPQTHIFTEEGVFTITATATDSTGATETATATISTTEPAAAVVTLTADKTEAYAPAEIALNAEIVTPGIPPDHALMWDYGDGTTETTTATHTRRLYTAPGTYTAKMIVKNHSGTMSAEAAVSITIKEPTYPAVTLTASTGAAAVTITDTAAHPDIQPDTALWDFGDGQTVTATTAEGIRQQTHTYAAPGVYVVTLTRRYPTGQATRGSTTAITMTARSTLKPVYSGVVINGEYAGRESL